MKNSLFEVGDIASMIIFVAPSISNPTVSISLKEKKVVKAGSKQFSFGNRNFKQAEVGKITEGIMHSMYVIIVPKGKDEDEYIEMAVKKIHTKALSVRKQCQDIITAVNEKMALSNFNNVKITKEYL